jgi:outer membrane receptor protein involved in Fe transport
MAPLAWAQTAPVAPPAAATPGAPAAPAAPAAQGATQSLVISGSRIRRDNFDTPAPVQIIRFEDSVVAGFVSTTDVLQGNQVTGGQAQINNAYGGFVTDGGPGANTIGLRGFAPTRTLILLNGRRLAPSGTRGSVGAADLNVLPSTIVDRIEILKDGSSSIYGSDAVAGVINIVTKRNLTGITAEARVTAPTEGGGEEQRFALIGGHVGDRSYLTASYEYFKRQDLTLGDRSWTQCNTDYRRTSANGVVGAWGSFDFVDPATGKPKCYPISGTGSNGVTINTLGTSSFTGVGAPGSVGTAFNRWRPNANVTTGLVGFEGVGGGVGAGANNLNVRDTFDPRMLKRSLISPVETHNVFVQGGMDLASAGAAELYFELLYNRRESSQVGYRQLTLDYMRFSPLIPANLAFSNFLPPQSTTNGVNVGVRAFVGFGNDTSSQKVDVGRAVVGVRGNLGATGWEYDVYATQHNSKGEYTFQSFLTDRLAKSSDVVVAGAGFACKDSTAVGCVAAPALTPAVIGGQLPADWVNYVFRPVTGTSKYKESVVSASMTGPLFKLPAGSVKAAVGVETRRFEIDDTPALDSQNGNLYGLTSSAITRGTDSANDVFAEIEVPLLAKVPGAEQLTASLSSRKADYKSYGPGSTYKAGLVWSPAKWLTLRATSGTSYRAPALYEQFLGATTGFISQQNDPCNNWDSPTNAGTPRAANCASENLPAGFTNNQGITVVSSGGRASGLKAETSENNTFGIILQPALPTGWGDLSVALDRFDIKVENGVARAGGVAILNRCYDDPAFRAGGGLCRLVSARTSSNALTVNDSYVNLATDVVRGLDLTVRYTNNVWIGRLRVNLNLTRYAFQASKLFADDELDNVNGSLNNPSRTGALEFNYEVKDWRFYFGTEYIGEMSSYEYLGQNPDTSTFLLKVPSYLTHQASVGYRADKWRLTVGVRNLTNKEPPVISAQAGYNRVGNAPLFSGYDYIGRRVFVTGSRSF